MVEESSVGVAIVGTGIGAIVHVPVARAAGLTVQALVGRDQAKTEQRAALLGIPHACTALDEALAVPGVDVVTVATPPFTHPEITHRAIAAGKHVICEKPLGRDTAEALALLRAAEHAGIVHLFGTEFRFFTPNALLERVVREGRIGEPRFAFFRAQMDTLADPTTEAPEWFFDAERGGSWLVGAGSHVLDQIRWMLGEFDQVSATLQTFRPGATADDLFAIHFRLHSGVDGVYLGSAATFGPRQWSTKIDGTRGSAWVEGFDVWLDDGTGPRQVPTPDDLAMPPLVSPPAELIQTAYDTFNATGTEIGPYKRVYETMVARIRGDATPSTAVAATFADGVALQAVIDAVHRSATERVAVTVAHPHL
jgi:predicted dehydrogenase